MVAGCGLIGDTVSLPTGMCNPSHLGLAPRENDTLPPPSRQALSTLGGPTRLLRVRHRTRPRSSLPFSALRRSIRPFIMRSCLWSAVLTVDYQTLPLA